MNRKDLSELADKELSIDYSLVDAYLQGAETMREQCCREVQGLADRLMQAYNSEDWQDVAHIALDIIPPVIQMTFVYAPARGYFGGGGYFKHSPAVTASAWQNNNFLVWIELKR